MTSLVLGAAAVAVAVHARLGPRLRWVLPTVSAALVASAAWIEIDRWWVTAVLAFDDAGFSAFVEHIEWAWPIHRITILLGVAATSVVLHWRLEVSSTRDPQGQAATQRSVGRSSGQHRREVASAREVDVEGLRDQTVHLGLAQHRTGVALAGLQIEAVGEQCGRIDAPEHPIALQ